MGGVRCEKGVLKLVYPGGSVEVHKEAITAAEVMKRNPRHCITRPDVFKYPWIVVRPESILSTGRVFFVVPYHTIRRLLQSHGIMPNSHSTDYKQQKQPPKHRLNGNSDIGLRKQTLPKETNDIMWGSEVAIMVDESLSNKRQGKTLYEQHEHYGCQPLIEPTRIQSRRRKNVSRYEYEDDYERRHVNSFDNIYGSHVVTNVPKEKENPTKVVNQQKTRSQEIRQEEKKRYPTAHRPLKEIHSSRTYPIHENRVGGTFFEENHKKNREVNNLKSCLRKPGICYPKRRGLKVTFVIPGDDDVKRVEIE